MLPVVMSGAPPDGGSRADEIDLRKYEKADEADVLSLLQASLGWVPDDLFGRFFRWKHEENAFGASPAWVAVHGDKVVGFRAFLRWEFVRGDQPIRAVRAVDTATHPAWQGRGLFSRLTTSALEELRADGVDFVFNTPNEKSGPGYLKMGWQVVGKVPVLARLSSWRVLRKVSQSRQAATKWSEPTSVGEPAAEVLGDRAAVAGLLSSQPRPAGVATARTPEFMRWRYGFAPLGYRALVPDGGSLEDGVILFRLRRRGPSVEAAICDVLTPDGDRRAAARLTAGVVRRSGADYAIRVGSGSWRGGFVPVPGLGPRLFWRSVSSTDMPSLGDWNLALGDVELF